MKLAITAGININDEKIYVSNINVTQQDYLYLRNYIKYKSDLYFKREDWTTVSSTNAAASFSSAVGYTESQKSLCVEYLDMTDSQVEQTQPGDTTKNYIKWINDKTQDPGTKYTEYSIVCLGLH